ncbi:aldehyde dehydrogenase family protein [Granulicoccus phenolivorans]|uniref:aldehyde dehydrogenase family protein n=1 Tax=Granulicoccus phenolivorans TaxID=266854 RepID=UPI000425CA0F|nr:aldehyde dehydrogenase family protein [Granulicoccus phenolivorans]
MTETAINLGATQTIAGKAAQNADFFDVLNPATEEVAGRAPECTDAQIDEAMAAAVAASTSDWLRDPAQRRAGLRDAAAALTARADEVARIIVTEQGKPYQAAYGEVMGSAVMFQYFADFEPSGTTVEDNAEVRVRVGNQAIGPTLGITAWNIPLMLASAKAAPAIAAGNPIILKPSPFTPLSTLALGEILRDVLPAGVLQVLTGTDALGPKLTARPEIRKITMTGSIATGKKIYAAGAADMKRVTLELGGNDAAILLDDFDAAAMGPRLFQAAFNNTGQLCICAKRIYVPDALVDAVAEVMTAQAQAQQIGDGFTEGVTMGPLQNKAQYDKVTALIEDAVAKGATVVTGGKRLEGPGYFMEPTVLKGCRPGMRVVDEEQFGPVMPLIAYSDLNDALEQANGTEFGLGGSVWGADVQRAEEVAAQVYSGMVWVNCHGDNQFPRQPFVGVKSSGLGAELGSWGYSHASDLRLDYTAL